MIHSPRSPIGCSVVWGYCVYIRCIASMLIEISFNFTSASKYLLQIRIDKHVSTQSNTIFNLVRVLEVIALLVLL